MYVRMTDNRISADKYNVCLGVSAGDAFIHKNHIAQNDTMEF